MRQSQLLHQTAHVTPLCDRCLQELTPDRHIVEQIVDQERGPLRRADLLQSFLLPTPPLPKAFDAIESLLAGVPDMVGRGGAAMAKRRVSPPLVFEGDVGLWT